jgi:hypothetical protein
MAPPEVIEVMSSCSFEVRAWPRSFPRVTSTAEITPVSYPEHCQRGSRICGVVQVIPKRKPPIETVIAISHAALDVGVLDRAEPMVVNDMLYVLLSIFAL